MLTKADEVYRGHGIVWWKPDGRGWLEAAIFPKVTPSGEVLGPALFEIARTPVGEGHDALRLKAQAIIDRTIESKADGS